MRTPKATAPPISHASRARISAPPPSPVSNTTRASSIDTENSTRTTRSASTTIASTVSLSRPRAPESATTAAVIVGEKETTITTSNASMTSRWSPTASGAMGNHGQTIHASDRQTDDGHGQRRRGHACDRRESGPEAFHAQRQAGDERDQRRGDSRHHLKLSGHRFGDEVAKGRPDDHAEEEIPRHAREMEPSQGVTGDRRAHQREPERERGGG